MARVKANQEHADKQAVMKADGEKVAEEVRPSLKKLNCCPSITVHPSNEAPVFALNVTLTEEQLRQVAALIATL
jgi:hypothetical protein